MNMHENSLTVLICLDEIFLSLSKLTLVFIMNR